MIARRLARSALGCVPGIAFFALSLGACSSVGTAVSAPEITVTASGEALSLSGFPHPTAPSESPYFVDGWEVRITELLVTVDRITVSENPDKSPSDQSQTDGVVAELLGPFAVDLHKGGPLSGKGGEDRAVELGKIANQNKNGGKPFAEDRKYAFGYDVVKATAGAKKIGFDSKNEADYQAMVEKGYAVYYEGTAEFKGTDCTPGEGDPVLSKIPKKVSFKFGFKNKIAFTNCQNPDLGDVPGGEGNPRGLAFKTGIPTVAQITLHADHPFWDANEEDAPLRFDHVAFVAGKKTAEGAPATVTLEDLAGVGFSPVSYEGVTLPSRVCRPSDAASGKELSLDPKGSTFADVAAFMTHLQTSQGHMNADGLCVVSAE